MVQGKGEGTSIAEFELCRVESPNEMCRVCLSGSGKGKG
jgi:hypothetical protein